MENNTIDKEALEVYQKLIDMGLSQNEITSFLERAVAITAYEMLSDDEKLEYILNSKKFKEMLREEFDIEAIIEKYRK